MAKLGDRVVVLSGTWEGAAGLARIELDIPPSSPFSLLSGRKPLFGVSLEEWSAELFRTKQTIELNESNLSVDRYVEPR